MKPSPDEMLLRQQFADLKQHDASLAPSFERMTRERVVSGRRQLAPVWQLTVTVAGLATVVLVATAVFIRAGADRRANARALEAARTMAGWVSPTDFLIDGFQEEWTGGLPTFSQPPQWVPFDDAKPESNNKSTKGTSSS
jgi:hypothetical protein